MFIPPPYPRFVRELIINLYPYSPTYTRFARETSIIQLHPVSSERPSPAKCPGGSVVSWGVPLALTRTHPRARCLRQIVYFLCPLFVTFWPASQICYCVSSSIHVLFTFYLFFFCARKKFIFILLIFNMLQTNAFFININ